MDTMREKRFLPRNISCLLLAAGICTNPVYADGLQDLKLALASLDSKTEIQGLVRNHIERVRGEGKDEVIKSGMAEVAVSDGEEGLKITYDNATLIKLDEESKAKAKDENADTPTMMAFDDLGAIAVRNIFSSVAELEKRLSQSDFIEETEIEFEGKRARKLMFELPLEAIITEKATRDYVDRFEGSYEIIIDDFGYPLQSQISFSGKGRAYVVLTVRIDSTSSTRYQVIGDRLVQASNEFYGSFSSSLFPDSRYQGGHELILPGSLQAMTNTGDKTP